MMYIADATQILDSPVVSVVVAIMGTVTISIATAVIGLFVKVSTLVHITKDTAEDIKAIREDKDIMRWSQWGPSHPDREQRRDVGKWRP